MLVLGANGISIETLPSNARRPMFHSEEERKRLGRKVASLESGTSFGQVGLLNRTPRSATCVSEGATLLVCDKTLYDRCVRHLHVDTPASIDLKVQLLRCHYIFSRWPVRQLTKLAFSVDLRKLTPKSILISQGDKASEFFVVVQGCLKCTVLQTVEKDPYTAKKQRELNKYYSVL